MSTAMHISKEFFQCYTQCKLIVLYCRLNLVLVDTAKGVKEVSDFLVTEVTYCFFSASTLGHDKLVNAQKEKRLKVLEIPQLSDTCWAHRYFAVNVYKSQYDCLVEALEEAIENSSDRTEATGILTRIQKFSFLVLTTFDSILGLTKPLSDALQVKHLNLSATLESVDSVIDLLKQTE